MNIQIGPIQAISNSYPLPLLKGFWRDAQGSAEYSIRFSTKNVLEAQAQIISGEKKTFHSILWKVHILSKSYLSELLIHQPNTFKIKIKRVKESFKVYIDSELLKAENNFYIKNLNLNCFTNDQGQIALSINWCKEQQDTAERQRFLLDIIRKSNKHPENHLAASNAITILSASKLSFSGQKLEGIHIPYAVLSNGIFEGTNFSGANLENVNFTNAILNFANLSHIRGHNINFGRLPDLEHEGLNYITRCFFSPNNRYFISIGSSSLCLWDLEICSLIKKIYFEYESILPSKDSQFLIAYSKDSLISILDLQTLTTIQTFYMANPEVFQILDIKFSYDYRFCIIFRNFNNTTDDYNSEIHLWETTHLMSKSSWQHYPGQQKILPSKNAFQRPFKILITGVSSKDNLLAIVGQTKENKYLIEILSISSLERVAFTYWEDSPQQIEFSPKEESLIIVIKNKVFAWPWRQNVKLELFTENAENISQMHVMANASLLGYLVINSKEKTRSNMIFRKLDTLRDIYHFVLDENSESILASIHHINISPDGNLLALCRGTRILLQKINDMNLQNTLSLTLGSITKAEFLPVKQAFVVTDASFHYGFDLRTGHLLFKDDAPQIIAATHQISYSDVYAYAQHHFCFISVENPLATQIQHSLEVWRQFPEEKLIEMPMDARLTKDDALAITPSIFPQGYIAAADQNNIIIWKIEGNEQQIKYRKFRIWAHEMGKHLKRLAFAKSSSLLLLATRKEILIVNIEKPEWKQTFLWGKESKKEDWFDAVQLEPLDFDISQDLCVVSYKFKGFLKGTSTIILWNMKTGQLLREIEVPLRIEHIQFSADGNFLAAWGKDGVRLWEVKNELPALLWSYPQFLEAKEVKFENAKLSPKNLTLLKQIGTKKTPLNFYNSLLYDLLNDQLYDNTPVEDDFEKRTKRALEKIVPQLQQKHKDRDQVNGKMIVLQAYAELHNFESMDELTIDQLTKKQIILKEALSINTRLFGEDEDTLELQKQLCKIYKQLKQEDQAIEGYRQLIQFHLKRTPLEQQAIAHFQEKLADTYLKCQNITEAIKEYTIALKIYLSNFSSEKTEIAVLCAKLGYLYCALEDYEKAKYYFSLGSELEAKLAANLCTKGLVYCLYSEGLACFDKENLKGAIENFEEGLQYFLSCDVILIGALYHNLGICYSS